MKNSMLMLMCALLLILQSCSSDDDSNSETLIPVVNDDNVAVDDSESLPPSLDSSTLVITEIMSDPKAVPDGQGEWFEIYNTSPDFTYTLEGLVISNGNSQFVVSTALSIEPKSFLVFSNNKDANTNGGINVDLEYTDVTLGNSGGQLSLSFDEEIIDVVDYGLFDLMTGRSSNLDIDRFSAIENDNPSGWCPASFELTSGDFGTPLAMNTACN